MLTDPPCCANAGDALVHSTAALHLACTQQQRRSLPGEKLREWVQLPSRTPSLNPKHRARSVGQRAHRRGAEQRRRRGRAACRATRRLTQGALQVQEPVSTAPNIKRAPKCRKGTQRTKIAGRGHRGGCSKRWSRAEASRRCERSSGLPQARAAIMSLRLCVLSRGEYEARCRQPYREKARPLVATIVDCHNEQA